MTHTHNKADTATKDTSKKENSNLTFKTASSHCRKMLASKIFIAITFTFIGIGGTVLAHTVKNETNSFHNTPPIHHHVGWMKQDPFFTDHGMFDEIKRMQAHMDAISKQHERYLNTVFQEQKKTASRSSKTSISQNEDDTHYYYQLHFSGFNKEDILVSITNNVLTLSAKKEETSQSEKSYAKSNFYYSFSIGDRNENIDPEITREEGKITVKIAK